MEFFGGALRPDFRSKQAQTHLHQPVVQVAEHDIVAARGKRVVEHDGANFQVCGCAKPSAHNAQLPVKAGRWNAPGLPAGRKRGWPARAKPGVDDVLNIGR